MSVRSGEVLAGMRLPATVTALGSPRRLSRADHAANRVVYRHGSLEEWYVNGPLGLEQGFTLGARPAGHGTGR